MWNKRWPAHPGRASLLDLKATLEMSLDEIDAARKTIDEFVAANPDSPTAHACQALLLAESEEPRRAIESLQKALALVEREMPLRVYEALGRRRRRAVGGRPHSGGASPPVVACGACAEGRLAGTRSAGGAESLFWFAAAAARSTPLSTLAAGCAVEGRSRRKRRSWPITASGSRRWRRSIAWAAKYGADPTLVFNRALLGGWLADDRALVAGLHAYAQLDVPLDDAVEAEAVAQLLDAELKEPRLDSVDSSRTRSTISTHWLRGSRPTSACNRSRWTRRQFAGRDQPRPRNTYVLLDRPMPAIGRRDHTRAVPRLAGVLAIYGRQTDRSERLELTIDKGPGVRGGHELAPGNWRRCARRIGGRDSHRLGLADGAGAQLALATAARYAAGVTPPN